MSPSIVTATLVLLLPAVAFLGGAAVMLKLSGRPDVGQKPLNRRFGYNLPAVRDYWGAFQDKGLAEQKLLQLDLAFPILYSGALAFSLLMAWKALGRPFHAAWLLVPLAVTVLADWTENLVQLNQLKRYRDDGEGALQEGWLRIASTATILKLSFFYASWLIFLSLIVLLLEPAFRA